MAAAAITAGSRRDFIAGGLRGVKVDLTSVADTNTWDPGLAIIEHVDVTATTAGAGTQVGCTVSNPASRLGRVTFAVESGTPDLSVIAWGY